jgi:hypothetical protein
MVLAHHFHSTGQAYDRIQWDDNIKKGSTIIVKSEGVVGLAWAWPVAITAAHGELHVFTDKTLLEEEFTPEQVEAAITIARNLGLTLA